MTWALGPILQISPQHPDVIPHLWEKLLDLQKKCYRREGELIGHLDLPPIRESVEDLRNPQEIFFMALCPAGHSPKIFLSCTWESETLRITRLMVDELWEGQGFATAIVTYVWERLRPKKCLVTTASKNVKACRLYEKLQMQAGRTYVVDEGISIQEYTRDFGVDFYE